MIPVDQVQIETNAVVKLLLSLIEGCAREAPEVAAHPHRLNSYRRQVVRRVWALVKLASRAEDPVE